jgi:hypothetical protein
MSLPQTDIRRNFAPQRPRRKPQPPTRRPARDPDLASLLAGWQRLGPDPLATRIEQLQRLAITRHLPEAAWQAVDRMRERLAVYGFRSRGGAR